MKRVLPFVFTLLAAGCGEKKTEEISKEEYRVVMGLVKGELEKNLCPCYITNPLPKWLFKKNLPPILIRKGYSLPVNIKPGKLRRATFRAIRRSCRQASMDLDVFSQAHARYGRLGLTYLGELDELCELLPDLIEQFETVVEGEGLTVKEVNKGPFRTGRSLLTSLDSKKLERAAQLGYDLGIPPFAENRILIEFNEDGNAFWEGKTLNWVFVKDTLRKSEIGLLVHILTDPRLPVRVLYESIESAKRCGAQRIGISDRFSQFLFVSPTHYDIARTKEEMSEWAVKAGILVEFIDEDSLLLDKEVIITNYDELASKVDSIMQYKADKFFLILLDEDEVNCGSLFDVCLILRGYGTVSVFSDILSERRYLI